jgi:ribosomal protein L44E
MKIRPVGAELFHADGQTQADRSDEGNSSFSKFRERAQKTQKPQQSVDVALTAQSMGQNTTTRNIREIRSKFG